MSSGGKRVRISNSGLNCYGTRVLTSGVELEQYKRNPVLLYMHRRGEVIGLMKDIRVEGDDITGEPYFDGITEESKIRKQQWEAGTLKMVSPNIDIISTSEKKDDLLPGQCRPTVTGSKLIEVSIVDIGGNDDAIILTYSGKQLKLAAGEDHPDLPLLNINNSINDQNKNEMDFKAIALKLGLPETATEADILNTISILLGYKTENEHLKAEKETLQLSSITQVVDKAIEEKKITAAMKDHFITLGKSVGLESLNTTLGAMSATMKPTGVIVNGGLQLSGSMTGAYKKLSEVPVDKLLLLRNDDRETYTKLFKAEYGFEPELED
jgi:hypothetical protein